MTTTTFPNGQVLQSSALTTAQINTVMQKLTTGMLGIADDDPLADSMVRLDWPTAGQPSYEVHEDLCFLRCVVSDDQYNRIRDKSTEHLDGENVTETWNYTRVWQISFTVVGPNSNDNARLIKSALFLDWALDSLEESNLFIVGDIADPVRVPELFQGQWWERVDLSCRMNEPVTETILTPALIESKIIIADADKHSATIDYSPPTFGGDGFDSGNYGI